LCSGAAPGWAGPALWLHGDLHPANVLTADGTICGVIDFGDLFAGDPACDLAAAWILLPDDTAGRSGLRRESCGGLSAEAGELVGVGHRVDPADLAAVGGELQDDDRERGVAWRASARLTAIRTR
jgi:hypothetical protein